MPCQAKFGSARGRCADKRWCDEIAAMSRATTDVCIGKQQQRDPDSRNATEWMHHEQWRLGVTGAHPCRGEVCIMLGMGWTGAAGAREMVLELHKSSWLHSMSWRTGSSGLLGGEIGEAAGNTMSCGGWATGLSSANIIHVVGNCVWVAAHIITTIVRADVRLREYARLTAAKTRTKTAACLVPESNGVWAEPPALRQSHSERHRAGQFAGRIKHGNLLFLELSPSLDWIQSGVVFIMGLGDNSIGDTLQCRRRADWIDTGHACLAAGSTSGVIRVSSKRHYQWHPPYHIMNKIAGLAPAQPKIMMLCPAPQSNCH
ncbi:hypothetical protein BD779DRAFT_1468022 [Infundibulicybe gibba]|nr:hypothetical protein BD779DRAFT_1468022 [Infundibulicybe gibba]